MLGSFIPQHYKWADLLPCVGLEIVVKVVEWERIFEMELVGVVVVVYVDGRDNMELGMGDIVENIQDIVDLSHKVLANLVAKICLQIETANVSKERVCSNYFQLDVRNLEIMNQVLASYQVHQAAMVLLELHNIAAFVTNLLHCPLGILPLTLVMMGNI